MTAGRAWTAGYGRVLSRWLTKLGWRLGEVPAIAGFRPRASVSARDLMEYNTRLRAMSKTTQGLSFTQAIDLVNRDAVKMRGPAPTMRMSQPTVGGGRVGSVVSTPSRPTGSSMVARSWSRPAAAGGKLGVGARRAMSAKPVARAVSTMAKPLARPGLLRRLLGSAVRRIR